jgi:hypothetical protein
LINEFLRVHQECNTLVLPPGDASSEPGNLHGAVARLAERVACHSLQNQDFALLKINWTMQYLDKIKSIMSAQRHKGHKSIFRKFSLCSVCLCGE